MTSLDGYGVLLGLYVRRDRWQVLAWVVAITLLYWSQAISIDGLYASQAELDTAAASMGDNAAFVALAGPARALNTVGGQVVWQATAIGAVLAGLMTMFLVGRHTRVEEEQGREELLRSAPVGRLAAVTAATTVAVAANLLVGVAVAVSLVGYGLAGRGLVGHRPRADADRVGVHRHRPGRHAGHRELAVGVRHRGRGARDRLRAARGRGRHRDRTELGEPDRLVPGTAPVLRAALVAGPPARRSGDWAQSRRRTRCCYGATSAPGSSRRDPAAPGAPGAAASPSPGASSEVRSSGGASGSC